MKGIVAGGRQALRVLAVGVGCRRHRSTTCSGPLPVGGSSEFPACTPLNFVVSLRREGSSTPALGKPRSTDTDAGQCAGITADQNVAIGIGGHRGHRQSCRRSTLMVSVRDQLSSSSNFSRCSRYCWRFFATSTGATFVVVNGLAYRLNFSSTVEAVRVSTFWERIRGVIVISFVGWKVKLDPAAHNVRRSLTSLPPRRAESVDPSRQICCSNRRRAWLRAYRPCGTFSAALQATADISAVDEILFMLASDSALIDVPIFASLVM